MAVKEILHCIEKLPYFREKLLELKSSRKVCFSGLVGSSKSAVLAALGKNCKNILVVTATISEAEKLKSEVDFFSGGDAKIFPAPDIFPVKEVAGKRLSILHRFHEGASGFIFCSVRAALSKTNRVVQSVRLLERQNVRMDVLIDRLIKFGYRRLDIVGERGEFSVRGGIIDIFPIHCDCPARLEFSGDKIESLRSFDAYSQRSSGNISRLILLPAVEKPEIPFFEFLPKETVVILDEVLKLEPLAEERRSNAELSSFLKAGEEPVFLSPQSYVRRLEEIPEKALIVSRHAARLKEEFPELKIIPGELSGGFAFEKITVISDRELFGEEIIPRKKAPPAREGVADELLSDLKIGDYVVHENYGIGICRGMHFLEIEGVRQEYLLIEYAEGDKLYVPPHMIGLVEKYSGGKEARPRISRLGSRQWLNICRKVKQSVQDLTRELLELYATREKLEGIAFPPDDLWQKELEAAFPYEETPDQAKAITAVKKDMESPRPMDRLVCGDVGYGKTEVALRATAKAASAGKQVAVLAPTTILVEQHYNNFKQRFQNLPYNIEMLSRFRSAKEQQQTARLLESGGIDVVIGTHRLLSKDIRFKSLGLLIIDEEQKFGVAHKEKLKKLKRNVDVLTLTATPIPRTLYFSLSGIREMSMISTPPLDRSPVRTHVLPFSEKVLREAILRELDRGGQVYVVHNFVETIAGFASKVKKLVPEAKVAAAHGQMPEKELEKTMLDFLAQKFNVLVCTAIIESGLDIPNVNTVLIDRSDRFGLSSLYQIRGRVGRSAVRAYAYLFYHPARSMTDQAVERLKAIQEFTALGSGYKLAMRDLEIRGSGNLLGAEQSGHIYEVGFDLYCELLEEAVKKIKGEPITPSREIALNLKAEAFIPANYITDERQRMAVYRRMNSLRDRREIEELRKELIDRFGKIPAVLEKLFDLLHLKVKALNAGVKNIKEEEGKVVVEWTSGKRRITDRKGIFRLF